MDFPFEVCITSAVRKKIAKNTAIKDVLPILNPAIAGFGLSKLFDLYDCDMIL